MAENKPADTFTQTYTMGYSEEFQKLLRRRSAEISAAHLLPHLEPGLRVLDFGCGPGTISMGLAKAVEPGELHGIDMEGSQIEIAQTAASAGRHDNTVFLKGDIASLPYQDDYFDVAHCHAVLMHVPDTQAVLKEVQRVLKPGGRISSREMIGASSFLEPEPEDLGGAWEAFRKLIQLNGGHPEMGKELKRVLVEAGFQDIEASASFELYSTAEDIEFYHAFASDWFFSTQTVAALTKGSLASQEQVERWHTLLDQWKDEPGACAAIGWGEAMGRKP